MGPAWVMGAIASGVGLGIGGIFAWMMKGVQQSFIYSLCTGLIMGLLFFEMIPESLQLGGWIILLVGVMTGTALFRLIHRLMDNVTIITRSPQKDIFVRTGILLTLSISVHNIPTGIVLGAMEDTDMGNVILLTLFLHNIPEGIIIFTPLFLAGFGMGTWMVCTVIVSFPIAMGSLFGHFIGMDFPYLLAFVVNITISVIFMVAIQEIFKESVKQSSMLYSLIVGIVGLAVIYLFTLTLG